MQLQEDVLLNLQKTASARENTIRNKIHDLVNYVDYIEIIQGCCDDLLKFGTVDSLLNDLIIVKNSNNRQDFNDTENYYLKNTTLSEINFEEFEKIDNTSSKFEIVTKTKTKSLDFDNRETKGREFRSHLFREHLKKYHKINPDMTIYQSLERRQESFTQDRIKMRYDSINDLFISL